MKYQSLLTKIVMEFSTITKSKGQGLCNIGHPYETHFKLKTHDSLLAHDVCLSCPIVAGNWNRS